MPTRRLTGILTALLLSLTSTTRTLAGLFDAWNCHMPVTVTGYKDYEPLTNFPLLVVLGTNIPAFNYKQFAFSDARDLRFTDASGNVELTYEIDHWDKNGNSYIWVKIPVLMGTHNTNYFDGQWIRNWSWTGEPIITRINGSGIRYMEYYGDNGNRTFATPGWMVADAYSMQQSLMFADQDPATGWTFANRPAAVTTGYVENQLLGRWSYDNSPRYLHFHNGYRYASDSQNTSGNFWWNFNLGVLYYTNALGQTLYLTNDLDRALFADYDPRTTNNPVNNPTYNTNTIPHQIIVHWGNPAATNVAYTTNGSMWSGNNMSGAWHMREAAAKDSKRSAADGTPSNITVTNGRFGSGLYFNSSLSSYINFGTFNPGFSGNAGYTIEGWFYRTANSGASVVYGSSGNLQAVGLGVNGGGQFTSIHNGTDETFDNSSYANGQWQHVLITHHAGDDSFNDLIYVNGRYSNSRGNNTGSGGPAHDSAACLSIPGSGSLSFGKSPWGTDYTGNQIMDEIRIHKTERNYPWIQATYQTMASNNTFQTYANIQGFTNILYGGTNPPGAFQFGSATYSVNETGRYINVIVQRPLDAGSNVSVQVNVNGGTAVDDTDYVIDSSTVSMGDGESSATFRIALANNALDDGDRTITLALSNPTGGATITSPSNSTITIQDDDVATLPNVLISYGTLWKYFDTNISMDPGATWAATNFNDSVWETGAAPLGYNTGAPDETTTTLSYGNDQANKIPAYYFRKKFVVGDPASIGSVTLKARVDDGCAFYINGTEVPGSRYLMTNGTITYQSFATNAALNGKPEQQFSASPSLLVAGTNVIAVEVHQVGASSSDVYIDMQVEMMAASTNSNFAAYNDASWQSGDSLGVTSAFTTFNPGGTASGTLISESGEQIPGVTVSMTTNNSLISFFAIGSTTNTPWATGQDAATEFEGKIGRGYACEIQGTDAVVTTTISGLSTGKQYKLVVWSSRLADSPSYETRYSEVRLTSIDNFINTSTSTDGVTRATTTMANDTTIIRAVYRSTYAPVTRFEQVRPGTDGTIVFTVRRSATSSGNAYLNAFKLVASDVSAGGDGDSDGMDDSWEQGYFGGTGQANGGATQDWDGDGFDNYSEYRAGTDPTAPGSRLELSNAAQVTGNNVVLTWSSVTGKTYAIQQSTNLMLPWNILQSGIPATPPANVHTASAGTVRSYIRVKLE